GFDGNTLQGLQGWQGQYDTMLRWHGRIQNAANGIASSDEFDFLLAFFGNCFSLRDWLLSAKVVEQAQIEELFRTHVQLRLCRDIANGFKHMNLRQPSVDAKFSIQNEYVPRGYIGKYSYPNGKWVVCADDATDWYKFGLVE